MRSLYIHRDQVPARVFRWLLKSVGVPKDDGRWTIQLMASSRTVSQLGHYLRSVVSEMSVTERMTYPNLRF